MWLNSENMTDMIWESGPIVTGENSQFCDQLQFPKKSQSDSYPKLDCFKLIGWSSSQNIYADHVILLWPILEELFKSTYQNSKVYHNDSMLQFSFIKEYCALFWLFSIFLNEVSGKKFRKEKRTKRKKRGEEKENKNRGRKKIK